LLSCKDKALLIRGDALLVLDLSLNVIDVIRGLNLKGDCLASKSFDEDLHFNLLLLCIYAYVSQLVKNSFFIILSIKIIYGLLPEIYKIQK